ncbi:hypothetical protein [Moraxella oblonga]|uniref:hypothetical protein n=1 Tax=Moraxella oblonga TaxID=200413 RepID=UPI00082C444E|nr:hypothetical protein [Moraxella oblonga]
MSSNGIYVYDIKHGSPKTYEEAHEILNTLSGFKESAPNPNMAAFGKKFGKFVHQAWQFYEGDVALKMCLNIEHETAHMLAAKYSFEFLPNQCDENFLCIMIRAASENNLVVVEGNRESVFLPDGTGFNVQGEQFHWEQFVEFGETNWQWRVNNEFINQDKPQIPASESKRNSLMSKIVKARLGDKLTELFKVYDVHSNYQAHFFSAKTELFSLFSAYIVTEKNKFDREEDVYRFKANIYFDIREEYEDKIANLGFSHKSSIFSFYGVSDNANPNIDIKKDDDGFWYGSWKVREYDEWVRLIEAAADMFMYYLPHIGTLEDFMKFVQAHDADETNFAELTMPETDPALRELCEQRWGLKPRD